MLRRDQLPQPERPSIEPSRDPRWAQWLEERSEQAERAIAVRGTPEAAAFIDRAKVATQAAIAAWNAKQLPYGRELLCQITQPRRLFGRIPCGTHTVEADRWHYFQVRVGLNGPHPEATATHVIAFDFGADNLHAAGDDSFRQAGGYWLREAIEALMAEHCYRPTLYVTARLPGATKGQPLRHRLAYSLADY